MLLWALLLLQEPTVSFSRDVAPILAFHCNGCHGNAGDLSTRTYQGLMKGGNLGKPIMPNDPEHSLLIHFVDGRRGEKHRMPLHGRPLSSEQIATLSKWIAQGATEDEDRGSKHSLELATVELDAKVLQVRCQFSAPAYIMATVRDPESGRVLWTEEGSVKTPREGMDLAAPGEWVTWNVRRESVWPRMVKAELATRYAPNKATAKCSATLVDPAAITGPHSIR